MSDAHDVAVGELVDERRRGTSATRSAVAEAPAARDRLRSYVVEYGCARPDPETVWGFGRRVIGEEYLLTEFGGDATATMCLLTGTGTVLFDRGGSLLENEYVAAFLDGYAAYHDGDFELHAQPLASTDALASVSAELEALGLMDGAAGPFADAVDRLATGLDDRLVADGATE